MADFIVTRKSDGVEVLRYSAAEAMPVNGFDFAYYEHTAFDPETPVAQVDASLWKIYVGAFFDRFGAAKIAILASDDLLAQAIIRDAEGATKFIRIAVEGGRSHAECKKVGYAIAHSPLTKTAFFASDPNLGRILAAIGYAEIDALDVEQIRVWLGSQGEEVLVAEKGGRAPSYREEDGARIMKAAEISVRVDLARGDSQASVFSCDLSYEYVRINADYRSGSSCL